MRGLVFDGSLALRADLPMPLAGPGEALVRVTRAGVCATDLAILRGYMGFSGILGHEFVGEVAAAPDPAWVGRRVVGEINAACGACPVCQAGNPRHCPHRTVLGIAGRNGAFAEHLVLPEANLHPVPDTVSDAAAVFVEPLAAAFRILEQVPVVPGRRAYVLGDGRLGLLVAQVLHGTGCNLMLVGRHPEKRALAAAWGIATADAGADLPPADLVVDCTGSPIGLERAVSLTRPCGTLVLKTTCAEAPAFNPAPLVIHEISVVGSRCGPFAPAIAALESGAVDVEPLIAATYPLADGVAACRHAARPGALKVQIVP
ncbi:MAG: alcohol dehydrogenase catalytic domain-containing protein [Nitrospirae bacterium]|nr:alcohol dehydrogenase catalytic domain-containing protein [Nitrospirota bacterium]